ncbi:MAG: hypothetical protein ACRDL8_07790 [Solirubrobacteraceae bacterium]
MGATATHAKLLIDVALHETAHAPETLSPVSRMRLPPSYVTGRLAESFRQEPTVEIEDAVYRSAVGSHLIYAPVQQHGKTIFAKRPQGMRFRIDDTLYTHVRAVTIPPHPYMPDPEELGSVLEAETRTRVADAIEG